VAGLQQSAPGYRRFRVQPRPGRGITSASAFHECPSGRIQVAWSIEGTAGRLQVTVPEGTEAELALPSGHRQTLGPGRHRATWNEGGDR
jgi:alpha-L-rhamnosidase